MSADPSCEKISVLFAFDANYAQHGAACIASLIRHSTAALDIVIASSQDPDTFADRFVRSFAGNPRVSLEFRRVQVPSDTVFPTPSKLTLDTYLRFWVDELLPGRARAIYLDPDTIVAGPIEELWRTDLRGNVLGAVPIPNSTRPATHRMPPGSQFFNAGVLLIDLQAWRERNCRDRCLGYLRRHPERALDGDQDILNLVLIGEWLPLDYVWNVINPFYRPSYDLKLPPAEVARICAQARIVHFNGSHKPWFYLDNHPRKAEYVRNLADTDWRDWRPPDLTPINRVRKRIATVLPKWAKRNGRALVQAARGLRGVSFPHKAASETH
jgi:lipopolysaccharide biosynthesis glycosyltransferase